MENPCKFNHVLTMKTKKSDILFVMLLVLFAASCNQTMNEAPKLQKQGVSTQLMVDGRPWLIRGGELHNSSSSNLEYLAPLWEPLVQMNLNTVLVAVSGQLIEPEEDRFDFSLVAGILQQARQHKMKVILLWFASWKNGLSHYAPIWVKEDVKRFPRIVLENGKSTETLSALYTEAAQADAKAFAALMRHLKKVDKRHRTVIMMQVQNEVGVIGGTRDYSAFANQEFAKPIPGELSNLLSNPDEQLQPVLKEHWMAAGSKTSGTWAEVFGHNYFADEAFMAWPYARYINTVAEAGKAEYHIPMFVNAWIVQPEDNKPGDYPAGGPQAHVHDLWRIGAPAIDILAPDVYLPNFTEIAAMYHRANNPLFVPESFAGEAGAANAFYAIGKHHALGYSPFGIDNKADDPSSTPIAKAYGVLAQLEAEILEAQAANTITAVSLTKADSIKSIELDGYQIEVSLRKTWTGIPLADRGYGLIIDKGNDEFIVAGSDINVVFVPNTSGHGMAGFEWVYEGQYIGGNWKPGRLLNGDAIMVSYKLADEALQTKTGPGLKLKKDPTVVIAKLYRF